MNASNSTKPLGAFQALAHYMADASTQIDGRPRPRARSSLESRTRPIDFALCADGQIILLRDSTEKQRRRLRADLGGRRRIHDRI